MDDKKIKKYERIAKITGILIGFVFILGTSYAVFKTVTRSEQTNTISAGRLDVQIENEQDEILLENSYPITEEEGLKQAPYTFDIVNKGSINAEYDLYIEIEENTTLPTEVVRYYLTVEEKGVEKIVTEKARIVTQEETKEREGKRLYKIDTKYLDTTKINKYKLYLWIDYEATKEQASNKYFEARVVVDSVQIYDQNRLVKQIDVSESGDGSVQAYMYADGTVYLKGKGTIASDLSDTVVYEKEGIVENYKKLLIEMGCNEEEVQAITSLEELEAYMEEQANNDESFYEKFDIAINKEIITEMGYDASSITDMDSLELWFIEQGLIDEDWNNTEEGEIFFEEFDSIYNEKYDPYPTPAKKIILEDGIENIPNGLFRYNEDIKEVRIPASVKRIDDRAFEGCRGLKEITIPNSVTSIGTSAFENCTSLTNVTIGNGVTNIGENVFSNCTNLTSIEIPNSVTSIGNYAFSNCSSLTNITIPNSVTSIGYSAFSNCRSLTEVVIPNSVTSIGNRVFASCGSLTEIEIPESVTSIGYDTFYDCIKIKKLTIDGTKNYKGLGMTNIEELVITGTGNMYDYFSAPWYSSRESIKKVTVSDTMTSIGNYAFDNCTNLTEISIPNSVTSIGNYAFSNCRSLISVTIPNNVTSIGEHAFYYCTSLTEIVIPNSVTSIGNYAFSNCSSLTSVTISNSIKSIGSSAFSGCANLTTIAIPNSVTSIGYNAFYLVGNINYNGSLSGTFGARARNGYIEGDYIYTDSSKTILAAYCGEESIVIIPTSVTSIGNYAFSNCSSLTNITIPNSVTSIGSNAFSYCTSLTSINIPNSVTSIGKSAFWYCTSLTSINIPNSVTSIGKSAFYNCTSLTSVTIGNSVTSIGNEAFYNCSSLTQITVEENNKNYVSIDGVLFDKKQTTIIKYPARKIGTSYTIPSSVNKIESHAFEYCKNLEKLEIPTSVTRIESLAFYDCTNIKEITIPNSVEYVSHMVFTGWTSSQVVNIDNTEAYVKANWDSDWKYGNPTVNYLRS